MSIGLVWPGRYIARRVGLQIESLQPELSRRLMTAMQRDSRCGAG
jgi:hypothetical protein